MLRFAQSILFARQSQLPHTHRFLGSFEGFRSVASIPRPNRSSNVVVKSARSAESERVATFIPHEEDTKRNANRMLLISAPFVALFAYIVLREQKKEMNEAIPWGDWNQLKSDIATRRAKLILIDSNRVNALVFFEAFVSTNQQNIAPMPSSSSSISPPAPPRPEYMVPLSTDVGLFLQLLSEFQSDLGWDPSYFVPVLFQSPALPHVSSSSGYPARASTSSNMREL